MGCQPPSKTPPPLSCQVPLKSANCPSPPFRQSPPSILVFCEPPPLKVRFFSEPSKYSSLSTLIPSYLLKVTKFLSKISQFEFLVMTEKNIFAYKLFLSLNISHFNLFFIRHLQLPLKKFTPFFPATPSKSWGSVEPPTFWKFGWRFNPPAERGEGRGVHTMLVN